ncbi:MAG: Rv2578c family radical SAM protein [Actinomycetota bacterium]
MAVGQGFPGLLRSVTTPEFAGVTFHEVLAKSVLNRVTGRTPGHGEWTINPYRGCTHRCVYCFARQSHTYLDFDAGDDFDREIVVKVNVVEVLRHELRRPSWVRAPVALGTNTDPYQRAEGRYELMPGIIEALTRAGTPLSILTKGTLLRRDLPLLASSAETIPVSLAMSIAVNDDFIHASAEPGVPHVEARLAVVRQVRDHGLTCAVLVAPVLPWLTDSVSQLDDLLALIADAGATSAAVLPLHLRPGAREWWMAWLAETHPTLVSRYRQLYARGSSAPISYRRWLHDRVQPLLIKHRLGGEVRQGGRCVAPSR